VEGFQEKADNILFEATVQFYRSPIGNPPRQNELLLTKATTTFPEPLLHIYQESGASRSVRDVSMSLDDVLRVITAQSSSSRWPNPLKRGKVYCTAVGLASKLSWRDTLTEIRVPLPEVDAKHQSSPEVAKAGRAGLFLGVSNELWDGLESDDWNKLILPYVSDGLSQPMACFSSVLDDVWPGWPTKITVWNYNVQFEDNGFHKIKCKDRDNDDDRRWFYVEYSLGGARDGIGCGQTKVWDVTSRSLVASTSFQVLCLE
jgi:hypothetical protein